jgi:A/G-specific adenine glycosylase
MDVFCCSYVKGQINLKGPVDFRWIRLEDLDAYPIPKANHKFIPFLKQRLGPTQTNTNRDISPEER